MILTLKNICKIENATIELNGITVIAGENDTGKSTVGKVLYCIFNSFYKLEEQIYRERKDAIDRILDMAYSNATNRLTKRFDIGEMADTILQNANSYIDSLDLLQKDILKLFLQNDGNIEKYINELLLEKTAKKVREFLDVPEETIFKTVLSKKLDSEFNGQINNIYFPEDIGHIELSINDNNVKISVIDNEVKEISEKFNLNTEVIYLDDPFALDDIKSMPPFSKYNNYSNHRVHLQSKLSGISGDSSVKDAIIEIITTNKIDNILSKINTICSGELIRTRKTSFGYKKNNSDAVLDVKNISTGLKTFVILKTLLLNGSLEENGTIVLDEPEIHLHPEWQLLFAELIVLIQKEFGMHILLNTHSPYFLNAIEVYAAKYKIADKCKYYMSENVDTKSVIIDVTHNIEKIYQKLARPLQNLENERYGDD